MSDTPKIPNGSDFIVVSDAQLTAFARAVIVAYRQEEAERPQPPALIATGPLVVDVLAFEAQVNGVVVPMKPREFKLLATLAKNLVTSFRASNCSNSHGARELIATTAPSTFTFCVSGAAWARMQSISSKRCPPSGTNCGGFR